MTRPSHPHMTPGAGNPAPGVVHRNAMMRRFGPGFVGVLAWAWVGTAAAQAGDSAAARDGRREVRRRDVTTALLATAFRDSSARALLARARAARLVTDRALRAYQARTWQRATMGLRFGSDGPERIFWRQEQVGEVTWTRDGGTAVRVTGLRSATPAAPGTVQGGPPPPLPWFPGKEQLWVGTGGIVTAEVDERRTINPLATGSEAYYTYATGDSTVMVLGVERLVLRELRVRPREPGWNVAVGSYWFDAATGQLVRATYRLTLPVNLSDRANAAIRRGDARIPRMFRMVAFPITGEISAITVEYGRYAERFWLPRVQVAEGEVRANVATIPVTYEERFRYDAVESETMPAVVALPPRTTVAGDEALPLPPMFDSLRGLPAEERRRIFQDYTRQVAASRARQCATGANFRVPLRRYNGAVIGVQEQPCDSSALASSAAFDGPLFPPDERPFAREASAELARELGLAVQSGYAPRPVEWAWPTERGLVRFNRVEGLSLGVGARQDLGAGYAWQGAVRVGLGDAWPNAELDLARSNGRTTVRAEGYRRLSSLNDWGMPFSFGESLLAVTAGRDEGFHARTSGAAVTLERDGAWRWELRGFGERVATAALATRETGLLGWDTRRLGTFVAAREGWYGGVAARARRTFGGDPDGWRLFTDLRGELAGGPVTYGRASAELSVRRAVGRMSLAATGAAGEGLGDVPQQRWWWLGGARTVRGQLAGTQAGAAYHLAQVEAGWRVGVVRPLVHADIGWAGVPTERTRGQPLSGAGLGFSAIDGLVRVDVSRGLAPVRAAWRVDVTFDARF